MAYLPIEDHGIIGDLYSVALVGKEGTIDWCCLPHFDSPSVFASILDDEKGGYFSLAANGAKKHVQHYLPDSNILLSRTYAQGGLGQVQDFMPINSNPSKIRESHQIIRQVSCVRGEISYTLNCRPAFNYARSSHTVSLVNGGALFETEGEYIYGLASPLPMQISGNGLTLNFTLKQGDSLCFTFFCTTKINGGNPLLQLGNPFEEFEKTATYWKRWIGRCTYNGRWSEMVYRSALTLKLLTFEQTGAIVAAPTMGLPEQIGGERNWDYRYTWIRDASFTVYALMRIGYTDEAHQFIQWLAARCDEVDVSAKNPLQLMYSISGKHDLKETILDHLSGYKGSKPVRLGNGAFNQLQLDIYGELMDSVYLYNKYGSPVSYHLWNNIRRIINWVAKNWDQPDESIWETRGGRKNFVFSRLMCWVALDRAVRMCVKHSLPGLVREWIIERDKIYDEIMTLGWNDKRKAFRQYYGGDPLDSGILLMPLVKFISPVDPRMISTIEATLQTLTTDSLVFRYDVSDSPDGLRGDEGTFCICTFWLVECLTRAGRLDEARSLFEKMLGYANHLGLYGEEIGYHGETLGNFPQAFTHLGLISAAYNLDSALSKKR